MAQVLRSVFGSRIGRGGARSLGRAARSRVGRGNMRSIGRMARSRAGRSVIGAYGRRMGRPGVGLFGRRHHRRSGVGRFGLLASLGALVLGGIFGGRRLMNRQNHRIGSQDVSRSQSYRNTPTSDY